MDIWQVLIIGFRRWRVTVPLAILGISIAWVFSASVNPTYSAEGSLLYLPPAATIVDPATLEIDPSAVEVVQVRNPFAGSVRSAVVAAEIYMTSREVGSEFRDLGLSTKYTVTSDRRNAVLYLEAEAGIPATAIRTIDRLVATATADLKARQDAFGVDPREQVTVQPITKDNIAVADLGGRVRARAILLVLAIGFAFGGGVLTEGFLDHRAGRRPFSKDSDDEMPVVGETLTIEIPADVARELGALTQLPSTSVEQGESTGDEDELQPDDLDPRSEWAAADGA